MDVILPPLNEFRDKPLRPNITTNLSLSQLSKLPTGSYVLMFRVERGEITSISATSLKRDGR